LKAAAEGLGIAFATQELIAPYLEQGALVPLLESWSAPFPGFYLCYPAQRLMAPALRAFIDALRAVANRA
jgi:DNA-binding transcriptional LysR family regulator